MVFGEAMVCRCEVTIDMARMSIALSEWEEEKRWMTEAGVLEKQKALECLVER
jgi:hypothetical protein